MTKLRMLLAGSALSFALPSLGYAQGAPCRYAQPIQSTAAESSHVLAAPTSGPSYLCWLTADIGATAGYLMIFDAATAPAGSGAAAPATLRYCAPIATNGTNGGLALSWPEGQAVPFTTGIVVGFSTTGCFTVTYSATASFFAGVQ